VFGICGGLQLLGRELSDPQGLEGQSDGLVAGASLISAGLDLLPLRTVFGDGKALRQRRCRALWPALAEGDEHDTSADADQQQELDLEGFELHRGSTTTLSPCRPLCADPDLGWLQARGDQGGLVAGTYLHGVFESGPWRRRWLNRLRRRRGLPMLSERQPHHSRQRDQLLERLADAFEQHVNLEPLLEQP
jgi:adenosylcobyric acid synthase